MREESHSSKAFVWKEARLFVSMSTARVSLKEVACASGRSSLWCERTPFTNESTFILSTVARLLAALYIALDGLFITSCNHASSHPSRGRLRSSCLANNAQMERAVTRIAGSLSAHSGRMRAISANCDRMLFIRGSDGDALAVRWTASKHTKRRRLRIPSSSPTAPGAQLRKRVERW